jgi:hypothetical protein
MVRRPAAISVFIVFTGIVKSIADAPRSGGDTVYTHQRRGH